MIHNAVISGLWPLVKKKSAAKPKAKKSLVQTEENNQKWFRKKKAASSNNQNLGGSQIGQFGIEAEKGKLKIFVSTACVEVCFCVMFTDLSLLLLLLLFCCWGCKLQPQQ